MNIVIRIYIMICFALLLFDVCFLFVKKHRNMGAYKIDINLARLIRMEIENRRKMESFSEDFLERLGKKIGKPQCLLTLLMVIDENPDTRDWFRNVIFSKYQDYARKDDYEQAYYAYVLSQFDYEEVKAPEEVVESVIRYLDSKSLYTFANSMECLYKMGDVPALIRAMDKVDVRAGFYQKKLLVDGLLTIKLGQEELNKILKDKFYSYKPYTQDCLIDYFRMCGYDIENLCYEILDGQAADSDIGYNAIRYLTKYPNATTRERLLTILQNEASSWVQQLLTIKGLHTFDDKAVYSAIYQKTKSPNWHVRVNAVGYIKDKGMSKEQILKFLEEGDRYANEALLYQYRDDKEISVYIVENLERLTQEAKEKQEENRA